MKKMEKLNAFLMKGRRIEIIFFGIMIVTFVAMIVSVWMTEIELISERSQVIICMISIGIEFLAAIVAGNYSRRRAGKPDFWRC